MSLNDHSNENSSTPQKIIDEDAPMFAPVTTLDLNANESQAPVPEAEQPDVQLITKLSLSKFEKRFRKEIIKPLNAILEQADQEEVLLAIRTKLFTILQGLYQVAKDYLKNDDARNVESGDVKDNIGGATNNKFNGSRSSLSLRHFSVPGLEMIEEAECKFEDPCAAKAAKEKLLPQAIRMLLQLGGKDGREFEYIGVRAEDLVVCILLDFIGFFREVLDMGANAGNQSKAADVSQNESSKDKEGGISCKKRTREEMESNSAVVQDEEATSASPRPKNILSFLGNELLASLANILACEACMSGHLQSIQVLRSDEWHCPLTESEAIQRLLPYFYKSTIEDDVGKLDSNIYDTELANGQDGREEFMTPLRTGEWAEYYCLYHPSVGDTMENQSILRESTFGRHLLAIARHFLQEDSLENLNILVGLSVDTESQSLDPERVKLTLFKAVMQIFHSISYISSFGHDSIESSDKLGIKRLHNDLVRFKSITANYLYSIRVGIDVCTLSDSRVVMDLLTFIEERSLSEGELKKYASIYQISSVAMDFITTEADAIKISLLWRFLTGCDNTIVIEKVQPAITPSLQCQVASLKELNFWLVMLENQIRDSEIDYQNNLQKSPLTESPNVEDIVVNMNTWYDDEGADRPVEGPPNRPDVVVDADDNGSTEVCCHSSGSVSSSEEIHESGRPSVTSEKDLDVKVAKKKGQEVEYNSISGTKDERPISNFNRGSILLEVIRHSKERFVAILNCLKSPRNNFLKHLFTSGHSELLKRMLPLLQLLLRNGYIEKEDIALMLNGSGMKEGSNDHQHGSVTSAVLDLLIGLVDSADCWNVKNAEIFRSLVTSVTSVETKTTWTFQTLSLLDSIVRRSIDMAIESNADIVLMPAGFDMLWRLADGSCGSADVNRKDMSNCAFRSLLSMIEGIFWRSLGKSAEDGFSDKESTEANSRIRQLQGLIIETILSVVTSNDKTCRTTSIRFLHFVISKMPSRNMKHASSTLQTENGCITFIEDLLERYDLNSVICEEIIRYTSQAKKELNRRGGPRSYLSVDDDIFVGQIYSHYECVAYREKLFHLFVARCFHVLASYEKAGNSINVLSQLDEAPSNKRPRDENNVLTEGNQRQPKRRHATVNICDDYDSLNNLRRSHTSLLPTSEQVIDIWSHLISDALSTRARDCVLNSFHYLLSSQDFGNISHEYDRWRIDTTTSLYPLCLAISPSTISVAGYQLLIYCVGHFNAEKNYVVIDSHQKIPNIAMSDVLLGLSLGGGRKIDYPVCSMHKSGHCYVAEVSNYSIKGLRHLWSILLESENEEVSDMAMRYIAYLYTYECISGGAVTGLQFKEQKSFIDGCFKILSVKNQNTHGFQRINRMLRLVHLFAESAMNTLGPKMSPNLVSHKRFSNAVNKIQVDDVMENNPPFSIKVNDIKGKRFTVECLFGRHTPVGFLRQTISHVMHCDDLRLIYNSAELIDDTVTADSLGIKSECTVYCCPRVSTASVSNRKVNHRDPGRKLSSESNLEDKRLAGKNTGLTANNLSGPNEAPSRIMYNSGITELASHRRLETLFSLLPLSGCTDKILVNNIRELAWDLLQLLPTELELEKQFEAAFCAERHGTWDALLPTPSSFLQSFRLLYALQALERFLLVMGTITENNRENKSEEYDVTVVKKCPSQEFCTSKGQMKAVPLVVIDTDNCELSQNGTNRQFSNNAKKNCHLINLRRMRGNGGIRHIVDLVLAIDLEEPLRDVNDVPSNNKLDHLSILMTCSNKIIYLMALLLRENGIDSPIDPSVSRILEENCEIFPLIAQFLRIINWAVTFQNLFLNVSSSGCQHQRSSTGETSGSLAIQTLRLMKDLVFSSESLMRNFFTEYCTGKYDIGKPKTFMNAMFGVLLKTSSRTVRSKGLAIFKQILLLDYGNDDGRSHHVHTATSTGKCLRSNVLSLLASILRLSRTDNRSYDSKAAPQLKVLFALIVKSVSDLWAELDAKAKHTILDELEEKLDENDFKQENGPKLNRITDVGNFFLWLLNDCIRVFRSTGDATFEWYSTGSITLLGSILDLIGTSKIKTLVTKVTVCEEKNLLQSLFEKCTFDMASGKRPALSSAARSEIGNIVRVLCKDCKNNVSIVLSSFDALAKYGSLRRDLVKIWDFDPLLMEKSETGFVGLKNQDATCYMNSLLQQLFCIPSFRRGVLFGLKPSEISADADQDEGQLMLLELQKLFGHLLLSSKRDFDTIDLVQCIRGYDGSPIRPGEQQDVDEFFNLFSDRLETALKQSSQSRILQNIFGGQLSHIITCQECGFSSERVEDITSISLDVKGKKDILESLTSYIQGDLLDGANRYFCSKCKAKRDSVKRCCVKTLPNVLICHLKRFDFDLEMLRKIKVNDRFEYPITLNLKAYTKEGIGNIENDTPTWRNDSYYEYELCGVLVHTGTADSGHYYSLCKVHHEDFIKESNLSDCQDDAWFCFNDSTVTKFDPSTLDSASFGGYFTKNNDSQRSSVNSKGSDGTKSFSAYLLVYERKDDLSFDAQTEGERVLSTSLNKKRVDALELSWKETILSENKRHELDKVVFSPEFRSLLVDICNMSRETNESSLKHPSLQAVKVITYQVFDVYIHSSANKREIEEVFVTLSKWFDSSVDACQWLIKVLSSTHKFWAEKILLHCPSSDIRRQFLDFMRTIIKKIVPLEREHYYENDDVIHNSSHDEDLDNVFDLDDDLTVDQISASMSPSKSCRLGRVEYWRSKSDLARFIGSLLEFTDTWSSSWRHMDQLFHLLNEFGRCGHEECIFLIRCGAILRLVDFYQSETSTVPNISIVRSPEAKKLVKERASAKAVMGNRSSKPNFVPLFSLLNMLTRSVHVPFDDDCDISDSDSDSDTCTDLVTKNYSSPYLTDHAVEAMANVVYKLPTRDARTLRSKELIEKMLSERSLPQKSHEAWQSLKLVVTQFVKSICLCNQETSACVCTVAGKVIADKKADEAELAVATLFSIIYIEDHLWQNRLHSVMDVVLKGIEANAEFEKEISLLLDTLIIETASRNGGEVGLEVEVKFHSLVLEKLEDIVTLIEQNASNRVKQKLFALMKVMLPLRDTISTSTNLKQKSISDLIRTYYDGDNFECYDRVREEYERKKHVDGRKIQYANIELVKDKIFDLLSGLYISVTESIIANTSNSSQDSMLNQDPIAAVYACATFSEYFTALRQCLLGPEGKARAMQDSTWIYSITDAVLAAFWAIDQDNRNSKRHHIDILKGEIIMLFRCFIQLDVKQVFDALVDGSIHCPSNTEDGQNENAKDDPFNKILEVFVTSNENAVFNNLYIVHFYKMLIDFGDHSSKFLNFLLRHDNWTWSLSAFVLNQDPAGRRCLYQTLLDSTKKYIQSDERFRRKVYTKIVECSKLFLRKSVDIGALELLISIFKAEGSLPHSSNGMDLDDVPRRCITAFISSKTGGMSILSAITKAIFDKFSEESFCDLDIVYLYACLKCTEVAIGPLTPKEVKKVIGSWPEFDETSFILTQVVTRTKQEWKLDDASEAITEIVDLARKLLLVTQSACSSKQ